MSSGRLQLIHASQTNHQKCCRPKQCHVCVNMCFTYTTYINVLITDSGGPNHVSERLRLTRVHEMNRIGQHFYQHVYGCSAYLYVLVYSLLANGVVFKVLFK